MAIRDLGDLKIQEAISVANMPAEIAARAPKRLYRWWQDNGPTSRERRKSLRHLYRRNLTRKSSVLRAARRRLVATLGQD